jgi:hypothetical protein
MVDARSRGKISAVQFRESGNQLHFKLVDLTTLQARIRSCVRGRRAHAFAACVCVYVCGGEGPEWLAGVSAR